MNGVRNRTSVYDNLFGATAVGNTTTSNLGFQFLEKIVVQIDVAWAVLQSNVEFMLLSTNSRG